MASHSKLASLQVVRALAAWTVVFHHYVQLYNENSTTALARFFWNHGKLGVDVFFVLSGFVMCLVLRNSVKGPAVFFMDRVFRIAPAYWFFTAILVGCLYVFPRGFFYTAFDTESLLKSIMFIPGLNPSGVGFVPVLTVGWTLNFEMFFYVILACCMAFSRRWALAIFLVLFALFPFIYPIDAPLSIIGTDPRLHEFWAGALVAAFWSKGFSSTLRNFSKLSLVAGVGFLIGGIAMLLRGHANIFALSVVVFALICEPYLKPESLFVRVFVHLGEISYSTYLAHCIVIGILIHLTGKGLPPSYQTVMLFTTVVGTYFMSLLSYRWIENNPHIAALRAFVIRFCKTKNNKKIANAQ